MAKAKNGDTVRVHYTGRLADGTVFDSSDGREPLECTLGQHRVIAGFENGLLGMEPGQQKTVEIPVDQAYGPRNDRLVFSIPRSKVPSQVPLQLGMQLQLGRPDGGAMMVTIAGITDSQVTLDANHSLAGNDLIFDLHLIEIA